MYPAQILSKLNDNEEETDDDEGNFVSYRLQDAILPWPLNYMHILPDWLIITVLGVVGLILLKVVMDPLLACMTLISDSSLSIIQRLASVIVPATTVSWIHSKKKPQIEMKEMEDVEDPSARLSMKSRSRQLLFSLGWSRSRQPQKFLVSMSLGLDNHRNSVSVSVSTLRLEEI